MFTGFEDRRVAGKALAVKLRAYKGDPDALVLALPRGGVPVAFEVAKALDLPLDVFVVRKLGVPWQPEFAFGAIASGGVRILNKQTVHSLQLSELLIDAVSKNEQMELERREWLYRGDRPALNVSGKTVIVVDDGLATGSTMRAAVRAVKLQNPAKIVVAAPVASRETCDRFFADTDNLCISVITPEPFYGVGVWYGNFSQTTDEEVQTLLAKAAESRNAWRSAA